MRRREFITVFSGAVAWPLVAEAALQSTMPVVGFLGIGSAESTTSEVTGFRQGLSESGYIEDRNVTVVGGAKQSAIYARGRSRSRSSGRHSSDGQRSSAGR